MKRTILIKKMIKDTGLSIKAFAKKADIPYTTLYSMLERSVGNASVDNVIKVCKALGITVEELNSLASKGSESVETTTTSIHFGEKLTNEEQEEVDNFIQYVLSKRKKQL